jgi:anaerobic selenocysteine-containing dehydrogenase
MIETRKSFCRICQAFCGHEITIEDGVITRLKGDRSDPQSEGYACFKGLKHLELYSSDCRLLKPLRQRSGVFASDSSETLLDEAGARLATIIENYGPESIGFFIGTQALFNTIVPPMIGGFATALRTPRVFTTMTIDQSAKWIGESRLGRWSAGPQPFETSDVWLFIGSNPVNSMVAGGGSNQFAFTQGILRLKRAKARGMKILVIDPRKSETACLADVHLQLRPGTDLFLAAALLHTIISGGWHDAPFCAGYVNGLGAVQKAVSPFSAEAVEPVVGVPAPLIRTAAKTFAKESRSGMAGTGTGPNMARHSNLAEHLYQALNVICGRFPRAGERVSTNSLLRGRANVTADVIMDAREWETGPTTLRKGLGQIKGTMMSAELAHEILHPDSRRMRALICVGGNPAVALPNQAVAEEALNALDLLVVIDPVMSATARLADYIFAPRLHFERADSTQYLESMFQNPFAHVTGPMVEPPAGSDVVEDWYVLLRLAEKVGVEISYGNTPLGSAADLTTLDLLRLLAENAEISFDELFAHEGALEPDIPPAYIGDRQSAARFELLPQDVSDELHRLGKRFPPPRRDNHFLLIVRRNKDLMNSSGSQLSATIKKHGSNKAFLRPEDMEQLGITPGTEIEIKSSVGCLRCPAALDPTLQRGIVSVSHGWSANPLVPFEATNALVDDERDIETINAMPVMTGIEITIHKVGPS